MNVLVVGGAGYIGSHCVKQLETSGHRPVVLDNLVFGHREAVAGHIAFHEGDLGDRALVKKVLREESIDLVMHFAAFAYVGESVTDPLKYYENNLSKTVSLLQAMQACGVAKFVFSSTCASYGVPEKMPMTEDLPQNPINPYGQTKLDVENLLKACAHAYGLSSASFRYFNAAGAASDGSIGEDHDPETHLIPLAIWAAQGKRDKLTVFGNDYDTPDGTCLRDYIHVDDLARAHIAVFNKMEKKGTCLFYNLGTGTPVSVLEVVNAVESVTGLKVPYEMGPRRMGDPPALYADSSKAQGELGWKPQYMDIRETISTAWEWHKNHPDGFSKQD
ncbi:MAG: UDP-glucose 4-epimerase GalE [Puniceicoccaceae bacterium]